METDAEKKIISAEDVITALEYELPDVFFTKSGRRTYTGNNIREIIQYTFKQAKGIDE